MKQILPFVKHRDQHKLVVVDKYNKFGFTTKCGNSIIDAQAGAYAFSLGYQNEEILDYIRSSMDGVPYVRANKYITSESVLRLQNKWSALSDSYLSHVFYGLGGSDALDTAIKMATEYWSALGQDDKNQIITFKDSYHGSTVAASYLCGMPVMNKQSPALKPNWVHYIDQPYHSEEESLKQLEAKVIELDGKVSAIIKEPVTLLGGVIKCSDEYHQVIRDICDKHNILLIVDDVATCGGKLGKFFGYQTMGVLPDIVTTAKSLTAGFAQLSATFTNERVGLVLEQKPFMTGWTFTPPMPGIYAAEKVCEIIQRNNLLKNVDDIENWIKDSCNALDDKIETFRVVGTFAAIQIKNDAEITRMKLFKKGLIVGSTCINGDQLLQMVLPINMQKQDVDAIFSVLNGVL
jgi:putrescine aminotransferase